jgi:hypothetical protein
MNKFTKSMFGYPGCSAETKSGEISPVRSSMINDTTIKVNMGAVVPGFMGRMLLKQNQEK